MTTPEGSVSGELEFELHGSIQVLNDYSLMHLRKRNCVESPSFYEIKNGQLEPFDELRSLRRLRRQVRKVEQLLETYSKQLI